MLLNCDVGEHDDSAIDAQLMSYINQASIACGGHAGNAATMQATLALAKAHGVVVGAHPSYPDKANFGRVSMPAKPAHIGAVVAQQISGLGQLAEAMGMAVAYVKPHGALYNDMMRDQPLRLAVMAAVAQSPWPLTLIIQATPAAEQHRQEARQWALALQFEAFADRAYADNGLLVPRSEAGAVLGAAALLQQAQQLLSTGAVTTRGGHRLALPADTLCVHGDNPSALAAIQALHALMST